MRRSKVVGVVLAVVCAAVPLAQTHAAVAAPTSGAELGPLVAGQATYQGGTLVWTDYAYDDAQPSGVPLVSETDFANYPVGVENAADLVQLQLSNAGGTRVTAVLETLVDPSLPLVGVGFDTDGNALTGAPSVPGGVWHNVLPLGLERFVVIDQSGARVLRSTVFGWQQIGTFASSVDPASNTVSATIPWFVLQSFGTSRTRVVGVAGMTTSSWFDGVGPIYDLAFVGGEDPVYPQNAKQTAILAGLAAPTDALFEVNRNAVASHATTQPVVGPGYHTFLYHSGLALAEGIGTGDASGTLFLGPYQPYMVWLPAQLPSGPAPLLVMLHASGETHLQPVFTGAPPGGLNSTTFGSDTFDVPAVVVTPLARGKGSYAWGDAEQDIFDVIANAHARFDIDPDRVVVSGISIGGLEAWRLAQLHPDRFSAIVPLISPSDLVLDEVFGGRQFEPTALGNLRNVPISAVGGLLDPLSQIVAAPAGHETDFVQLTALGYQVRWWAMTLRHHQIVPSAENCVLLDALAVAAVADPARVTFTTEPALEVANPATGLDIRYRNAYWLDDIESRDQSPATVDATSLACADRVTTSAVQAPVVGQNITGPADVCGTPGSASQTLDTWTMLENRVSPGPGQPTTNGLHVALTNVGRAQLDLARASVDPTQSVRIEVTGDGTSTLRLVGSWPGTVTVTKDGAPFATVTTSGGVLELSGDFSGTHTFVAAAG